MQPCEHIDCSRWVAYGTHCAKHEPKPEPAKAKAKASKTLLPTVEDRRGVPAIDATEVRYSQRPRVSPIKPWSHVRGGTKALSDCTVTRADGSSYVIPANRRNRQTHDSKPKYVAIDPHEATRVKLLSIAAAANRNHDYNEQ